jgi:hypothetical protein
MLVLLLETFPAPGSCEGGVSADPSGSTVFVEPSKVVELESAPDEFCSVVEVVVEVTVEVAASVSWLGVAASLETVVSWGAEATSCSMTLSLTITRSAGGLKNSE